ncbi:protein disulfide-isomerase domain [Allomyces macrogynus ATCC 38327]|uniref:Protein disulfide-isomerase domain n=1 Tax=Allomyces macrogynus (strain ATCC 38327) TaxID=578462 RepID=A0A0L0TC80_ALLM3|nr:protein disulfide-isomerase domain [Allomyces macrogynus ATCC 38327]|eukprot:KNE72352.1 protein disulfide-isomerase domain [Allomyces macrogynus ATCC 38327]
MWLMHAARPSRRPLTAAAIVAALATFIMMLAVVQVVSATPRAPATWHTAPTNLIPLTSKNFDDKVKSGTWMIEFFAPWCPHCKKLAPKYEKLATTALPWRAEHDFYVARVDCVADQPLCDRAKVDGFPTIFLYNKGQQIEEYDTDLSAAGLIKYAKSVIARYPKDASSSAPAAAPAAPAAAAKSTTGHKAATDAAPAAPAPASRAAKDAEFQQLAAERNVPVPGIGKYGKVVDLNSASFDEVVSQGGPWLLEFYAPWCGHCRHLEPIYDQLGKALAGKMNVARIDADLDAALGSRFGIKGFPTIKLYRGGQTVEYRGPRTLQALYDYALSAVQPAPVPLVDAAQWAQTTKEYEVAVAYVYDEATSKDATRAFLSAIEQWTGAGVGAVVASSDAAVASGVKRPAVVVARRGYDEVASIDVKGGDSAAIAAFVRANQYALVPELTDSNAGDLMQAGKVRGSATARHIVLLAILDAAHAAPDSREQTVVQQAARDLRAKYTSDTTVNVQTIWVDGVKWSEYVLRVYGLTARDLPRVIVSDPHAETFWAKNQQGEPVAFTRAALVAAVDGVVSGDGGELVAQHTRGAVAGYVQRVAGAVQGTPTWVMVAGVGAVAVAAWVLCCRGDADDGDGRKRD